MANISTLFLFRAEKYSIIQIRHILFFHSSANGHVGCFYLLAIVDNAAISIDVQVSVLVSAFISSLE